MDLNEPNLSIKDLSEKKMKLSNVNFMSAPTEP